MKSIAVQSGFFIVMSMIVASIYFITASQTARAQNAPATPTTPATPPSLAPAEGYTPDPVATAVQTLQGKLFFTDSERARADKARKDLAAGLSVGIEDEGESVVIERKSVLNGFMTRSDGATTYWLNGGGASNTRFALSPMQPVNIAMRPTASLVGGEPMFILTGTTVGVASVNAKKDTKKKAATKKTTAKALTKQDAQKKQKKSKRKQVTK